MMTRFSKKMAGVLALALLLISMVPISVKAQDAVGKVVLSVPENKALTYQAQQENPPVFRVIVSNNTATNLQNVVVKPDLRKDGDRWPFKTEQQSYAQVIENIPAGAEAYADFAFSARDNVPTSRFTLRFSCSANDVEVAAASFYVNAVAKPEDKPKEDGGSTPPGMLGGSKDNAGDGAGGDTMPLSAAAGGISNGDASFSGGSGGSGSVPRVIVTGFDTDPAQVRAGSDFKLTIHLKNTAKGTKVSNMLFDLQAPTEGADEQAAAPAFLPASGASSIYLESIPANGTADISIQLNAKGDLLQKPYSVNLSMKYEDGNAAQVEGESSISIPVKQDARFEFSEFEISPEAIAMEEEANVMCSLYNLGRIKLYNVKATFEGKGIKKEEVFVGNVESGASASIDATVEGIKETQGPSKITMTVSYEDEAGKASTTTKELQLEVTAIQEENVDMAMMEEVPESKFPIFPFIIIGAVIAAVIIAVIVVKRKKQKLMADEEEELINEVDRPAEDER